VAFLLYFYFLLIQTNLTMKKILLFTVFIMFMGTTVSSQVTTSNIRGSVTDSQNEPLPGTSVVAKHVPSGTVYGTDAQLSGTYNLANMRVGGPYKVSVSFIGYKEQVFENIFLQVGEKLKLNISLTEEASQLDEILIVSTKNATINSGRTGSSTSINREQIKSLPTISRSINDLTRLTPSSDGNSFGGGNNKMNNLSLDGSIFNNPFGLDGGTPGSQTNAQPVSLDAIDQIQIDIAPFDVTSSGFTGASINAVTKSGTNEFHGSIFGFFRNESLTGSKVGNTELSKADLNHTQSGFSIGGPIIKDKLFFFANAEIERREDLVSGFRANNGGETVEGSISRVLREDLDAVSSALDALGYKTGGYENLQHATDNEKFIMKLDWNINDNHSLTATYNQLDATRDKPAHPTALGNRGPNATTLQFENSAYSINNKLQSGIIELKSRFGAKYSNNLQVGYTHFDDFRTPFSNPAPPITILKGGSPYIIAGHEPFSINNKLKQKVFQITNNFKIYSGNHTVTLGASFEKFQFENSFNLDAYGARGLFFPTAGSVAEFLTLAADPNGIAADIATAQATFDNNNANNSWSQADTNVGQLSVYAQDEIVFFDDFTLTIGLRVDKPNYFDTADKVQENIDNNCCYDPSIEYFNPDGSSLNYDSTKFPGENTLLLSPRMGFNWDLKGDNTKQLRGGVGIFTGRLPFVWIGNQVQNVNSFYYHAIAPNFNFPQVFRTSLGYDQKFENGLTVSTDVMYSKNMDAIFATNIGLKSPTGILQGVGGRPIYEAGDVGNMGWAVTNTDVGNVVNFSVQLKKQWENNFNMSIAYDYLNAKDANSPTEELTDATFGANPNFGNVNIAKASSSSFGHKHRIVGSAYKKFNYGDGKWSTTLTTFFEYTESGRHSFVYGGDINGDGSGQNDLIYIPTSSELSTMAFDPNLAPPSEQMAAFENYIQQDDYLNSHRGGFASRNATLAPWFSNWDFRIAQDYNFGENSDKKIQFTIDILNVGNLISSDWGVRQIPTNTQPIGVSVDNGIPTYAFDSSLKSTYSDDLSLLSRWQAQLGLRYSF
jgi:hypothetical protein